MEQIVRQQLLDRAAALFREVGVRLPHEEQLAAALDCTPTEFRQVFGSKEMLLCAVTEHNLARQRQEHAELFANLDTPAECLVGLLRYDMNELRQAPHYDYHIMRTQFPRAWQLIDEHLHTYARPLLVRLLQGGIDQGQFRASLDASLIAHIILAQFSLVLNEQLFPPDELDLSLIYHNIFTPYVRGLCTPAGLHAVATHFERF
ncbi:TetR/AcrR family transcriptional regulator [Hymenobacter lapidiphilus]|uniref:TetR/AcrR family transcriptional regulator n=1 Tax=Hymenobacter sp. CCM 8763 TaxID=2303334 RepID=UPI000E347C5C|nr:TetR/AcrR family transcriptional regulator [Hymenobacter sp. CCM 8763]RFP64895.1 TetR/AcrR family transcriptional regulator [Hymenobacter sp. CCM 8763]